MYARDGSVIGDFAEERRTIVSYEAIPPVLREAFIAAEDGNFLSHIGVDPTRIAITAVRRLLTSAGVNATVAAGLVAAIGDVRAARIAGTTAASIVTPMPTIASSSTPSPSSLSCFSAW